MSRELIVVFIKALMTFGGSYLIGHNLLGNTIDSNIWETIAGFVFSIVSVVWSVIDKNLKSDVIISLVRQIAMFIGGLLVSSGKVPEERVNAWLGLLLPIVMVVQSVVQKKQAAKIQSGELPKSELKTIPIDKN